MIPMSFWRDYFPIVRQRVRARQFHSPRVQLFEVPWAFFRQRWEHCPEIQPQELEKFKTFELA
jgi:hypothetical protein